jgi:cytochrome c
MACRGSDNADINEHPSRYGLGHTATPAEIAVIDIDANASGVGLPAGQGTAATGAIIYAQKCAVCHGAKGEGIDKYPKLIGREPPAGFVFASDFKAPKTIGNYWPYATTLYDYMHRTMPLTSPNSLTPDETYSLVAFLLSENGIIPATTTVDAKSLAAIKMPAQPHFVPDNRRGGTGFK